MASSKTIERKRAANARSYAKHKDERKAKQHQYYIEHREDLCKRQIEKSRYEREVELPQLCKRFADACNAIKSAVRERSDAQSRTWVWLNVDGRFIFQELLLEKREETLQDVNTS